MVELFKTHTIELEPKKDMKLGNKKRKRRMTKKEKEIMEQGKKKEIKQTGGHYTNGIAESINNHLKTIIKTAYGYHNFIRFRKRAMMILTYKKDLH